MAAPKLFGMDRYGPNGGSLRSPVAALRELDLISLFAGVAGVVAGATQV